VVLVVGGKLVQGLLEQVLVWKVVGGKQVLVWKVVGDKQVLELLEQVLVWKVVGGKQVLVEVAGIVAIEVVVELELVLGMMEEELIEELEQSELLIEVASTVGLVEIAVELVVVAAYRLEQQAMMAKELAMMECHGVVLVASIAEVVEVLKLLHHR